MTMNNFQFSIFNLQKKRGYTLIELIVAVGLFSLVMLLASGSYLMMIGLSRQAQGIAIGIDNLSFATEAMARDIRTGTSYNCGGLGDCPGGASSFSFINSSGVLVSYEQGTQQGINSIVGDITKDGGVALTDPSVNITSLTFYTSESSSQTARQGDYQQPHVTIVVSGTVSYAAGKSEPFNIETGATMRGSDL